MISLILSGTLCGFSVALAGGIDGVEELNNIHPQVNFTFEPMVNNQMPFLDCLFIREGNNLEVKLSENQRTRVNTFIRPLM